MRRWFLLTIAALAAGLAAGGVSLARGSEDGLKEPVTLKFLEGEGDFASADVAPSGPSAGDMDIFDNPLRNRADTRTVGRIKGVCTHLVASGDIHCSVTALLRKGTIELAGALNFEQGGGRAVSAVTGGTGKYRNARGQLEIDGALLTFRLFP